MIQRESEIKFQKTQAGFESGFIGPSTRVADVIATNQNPLISSFSKVSKLFQKDKNSPQRLHEKNENNFE